MSDLEVLEQVHALLRPRTYMQLGLKRPELMALAQCGAIGVASMPRISEGGLEEKPWLKLYAMEPGDFLANAKPEHALEHAPLDLVVFEDGRPSPELARNLDALVRWAHPNTHALILGGDNRGESLEQLARFVREQHPAFQVRVAVEGLAAVLVNGFGAARHTTQDLSTARSDRPTSKAAPPGPHPDPLGSLFPNLVPKPASASRVTGRRDAAVFAWYVPEGMPELGDYYLGLLSEHHADAKVFVGMNHGSDPVWAQRFRDSELDVEVRWARPEIGDYWDATGFLTALEGFHHSDEAFRLVWFAHTKGGSLTRFEEYASIRSVLEESFWRRRERIERLFDDPVIGIFAPHFCPLPPAYYARELYALQRVYRDRYAPLGLHCRGTFYVMREEIVRAFCKAVGEDFFCTDPGAYDGGRYLFEIGFPSIATMQGYEPFINPDVPGDNDPRDDVWIAHDVKQNHRIASVELKRWRGDRVGFEPREMEELFI
jgi:hypothetical protein